MIKKTIFIALIVCLIATFNVFGQTKPVLDKRAYNHYNIDEINIMPASKIEKLNFLFQQSYLIPEDMAGIIIPDNVDVYSFSGFRKEDERVSVPLMITKELPSEEYIILLSFKELDQAYRQIDQKYETK